MLTYPAIDKFLQALLVDPLGKTWDQPLRAQAINEALIALGGLLPYEFAQPVTITYDAAQNCFPLPETASRLLEVHTYKNGTGCVGLLPSTFAAAMTADVCFLCPDGALIPTTYVWSDKNPRRIYLNGKPAAGSTLEVIASVLPTDLEKITGNIPIDPAYLPMILDYAQRRLRNVEDTSGPTQTLYDQLYKQGVDNKASIDMRFNPITADQAVQTRKR